jgi:hypothetical protein
MTTTNTVLGSRPAPEMIRFDDDCFECAGSREFFVVALAAPSYPKRFDDRAAAEKFARKAGRTVSVEFERIMRRVKWF